MCGGTIAYFTSGFPQWFHREFISLWGMVTPGPTMISCPSCAGVVRANVGPGRHLELVCSVGHVFSLEELYTAKEDQLEYAQWSLLALLKHLQMILEMAIDEGAAQNMSFSQEKLQQRLDQTILQLIQVKQIIEDTRLPVSDKMGDGTDPVRSEGV